jgi:hypothetical protein
LCGDVGSLHSAAITTQFKEPKHGETSTAIAKTDVAEAVCIKIRKVGGNRLELDEPNRGCIDGPGRVPA